ncbi:MAG: DUF4125 family protein [Clostridia bacterium]|nr:DUF4125 family protein [Clostridia bacterium]
MNDTIKQIIDIEWEMFHTVNGDDRVSCQNERPTFTLMRNAQFSAWDDATTASYLEDLKEAVAAGRSLVREKYIRMMEFSDPVGYDNFKSVLPEDSEEKKQIVSDIWAIMLAQTEKIREKYPILALGGRPLHTSEEKDWPSVETYQKSELFTYSEKTLKSLLAHAKVLEAQGISLAYNIQENSVLCLGYKTMQEAEMAMAGQLMAEMGITLDTGDCPTCHIPDEY